MNILFLNTYQPTTNASGGIARVTCNLGNLFTLNGHKCSLAYYHASQGNEEKCFEKSVQLTLYKEQPRLEELAACCNVFIIQIQMSKAYLHLISLLDSIKKKFGTKLVYCHHSVPFAEAAGYDLSYLGFLLLHSNLRFTERIKESLWCLTAILFPNYAVRKIARRRQYVTDHVDKTVLLSEKFIPTFRKYVDCPENKVVGIGNCCTFNDRLPAGELDSKEKTVLIVANMNEHAKRVSAMLHIWKKVSEKDVNSDWKLKLVGTGPDLDYYRKLSKRLKLKNCFFEGKQDPRPYYIKSSILLMASAFEGFGMVILEAQQMGCVPVVYESYQSVHDLITDGHNGLLIPNKQQNEYIKRLIGLMKDDNSRNRMALNCINMENRFTPEVIYSRWKSLFDSLHNSNR